MKLEALANELTQLDQSFDQEAGKEEPDVKVIGALQKRRTQLLQEQEVFARRVVALTEQVKQQEAQEAEERLIEIAAELEALAEKGAEQTHHFYSLMTQALAELDSIKAALAREALRRSEAEYLRRVFNLSPQNMPGGIPAPERNALHQLEGVLSHMRPSIFSKDVWQRKLEQWKTANRKAAKEEERKPGIRTIGEGKHWSTISREGDEAKARELDRAIVRGPSHIIDLQRR